MQSLVSTDPGNIADFRLSGVLGRGGQGTVYLGQDSAGHKVAVKVLNIHVAADQAARRRFEREAEAARRVAGFCTARVLDAGVADGRPYIVSEFVAGQTLDSLVRGDGVRSGSGLERLAVATLTALTAIHRAGIVHRDFKPSNVVMGAEGPVVIDFGIARAFDQTVTSSVIGTPAFMAPEQFMGGAIGPEADLFSWAGTMVFAATGRHAFAGDTTPSVMRAILEAEPDLTGVPGALRPVLGKCLAKDPKRRPNAAEVLRWVTGEQPALSVDDQATAPLTPPTRPMFAQPRTRLLDPDERTPPAAVPGADRPNIPLLTAASVIINAAGLVGLLSMPMALDISILATISMSLLLLSSPVLGAAVWRYHIGARFALCSTLPFSLLFLAWLATPEMSYGFPDMLFVFMPLALQGVAFVVAAAFLRRTGTTVTILGVAAGSALAVCATGRVLAGLPTVHVDDGLFVFLMMMGAASIVLGCAWVTLLSIASVRRP
ncbi:Serine/threonine protein kinase [Micromonospora citrea]|uniref:Serine/threonine protein kinase n=1 Tax=Micromonospora citrea TaxID=47855 RepID=A0A1C6VZ77_9ACTN|nr:serine/threonine-protein kinase [Micromonospora citrea]SCL71596.1 Serine/threonine protein kinase [Micromonospora citrea]